MVTYFRRVCVEYLVSKFPYRSTDNKLRAAAEKLKAIGGRCETSDGIHYISFEFTTRGRAEKFKAQADLMGLNTELIYTGP